MNATRTPQLILPGLLVATGFSVMGNSMVALLIPWLILEETGNPSLAGSIAAVAGVAGLASMVVGGGIIDRVDRRNFAVFADILSAFAVAALPAVHHFFGLTTAWLVALVALGALFDGPGLAAREALRPRVAAASKTSLERINALSDVLDNLGLLIGPAIAGLMLAAVGTYSALWWSAGVFLIAAAVFAVTQPKDREVDDDVRQDTIVASSLKGVKLVWDDPVLRAVAICVAVFGFCLAPIIFLLTVAFEARDASAELGAVLGAFAIGSIVGALSYGAVGEKLPRRGTLIVSTVLSAIGMGGMAFVLDNTPALLAVTLLTGLVAAPSGPVLNVLLQLRTIEKVRGRVIAVMGVIGLTASPLSLAAAGWLLAVLPTYQVYLLCASGLLFTAVLVGVLPGYRNVDEPDFGMPEPAAGTDKGAAGVSVTAGSSSDQDPLRAATAESTTSGDSAQTINPGDGG